MDRRFEGRAKTVVDDDSLRIATIAAAATARETCFQSGLDDFLFKPITIEPLSAMMVNVKWIRPA